MGGEGRGGECGRHSACTPLLRLRVWHREGRGCGEGDSSKLGCWLWRLWGGGLSVIGCAGHSSHWSCVT